VSLPAYCTIKWEWAPKTHNKGSKIKTTSKNTSKEITAEGKQIKQQKPKQKKTLTNMKSN
jgi:hypothetical protein